jgi:hypothetical protein
MSRRGRRTEGGGGGGGSRWDEGFFLLIYFFPENLQFWATKELPKTFLKPLVTLVTLASTKLTEIPYVCFSGKYFRF